MRQDVRYAMNSDLAAKGALEDELYVQADKLLALCAAQSALDSCDSPLPFGIRGNYSVLMEEQARILRNTLDRLFA